MTDRPWSDCSKEERRFFKEVEDAFKKVKKQFLEGKISNEEFEKTKMKLLAKLELIEIIFD